MMRLTGLDMARFLAFFGMVLVNFRIAAQVAPTADLPSLLTNALEGRAAALFVVLAGIGLGLSGASGPLVFRRALFLMALGLLNLVIFEADILHYYATYFLCALPFLRLSARQLLALSVLITLLAALGIVVLNYDAGWNWETLHYRGFWTLTGYLRHTFYNGWHPVLPWIAFLFLGMALARLDLAASATQRRLMLWGAICFALGLMPGALLTQEELRLFLGTSPIPPGPFYILSAGGSAVGVTGLMLRLGPWLFTTGIGRALERGGRQSLTFYIAHILLGMGLLEAQGLLEGGMTPVQNFGYALAFCGVCLIYATLWAKRFKHGPLEALMRQLAG